MTAPIAEPSFYADFHGLAALRSAARDDTRAQDPATLRQVAQQFESLFMQMLLKSMREANRGLGGDALFGSDQADFYQGMFDNQIAMHLAQGQGLGLADMLVQQLSRGRMVDTGAAQARAPVQPAAVTSGAAAAAPHRLATSREDFVARFMPHAQAAAREIGVDPHALLAQAALETGWGRSVPCGPNGECSYNLFGIKAGRSWSGASVGVPTLEFEDGVAVRKVERFRAYASVADSFRDYAGLIRNNPRYADAVGAGEDVAAFAAALQRGGYATDPQYASKLVALTEQLRAITSRSSHG